MAGEVGLQYASRLALGARARTLRVLMDVRPPASGASNKTSLQRPCWLCPHRP